MAEHYPTSSQRHPSTPPTVTTTHTSTTPFLRKLQEHASNSTQLFGLFALLITGSILFLLTALTVAATVLGLVLFSPLIILSSPIWAPPCILIFIAATAFLSLCGFGVVLVAAFCWAYRYFRRHRSTGSDRVEYALDRFYDSVSREKEYGRGYEYGGNGSGSGGYSQSKVKYAAPGA